MNKSFPLLILYILLSSCISSPSNQPLVHPSLLEEINISEGFPAITEPWPYEMPMGIIDHTQQQEEMIAKTIAFLEENTRSFWGTLENKDKEEYLTLLNEMTQALEYNCMSFTNLDINWEEEKEICRTRINQAQGHGEALGAISRLMVSLQDAHVEFRPTLMLNRLSTMYAIDGIPQLLIGNEGPSQSGANFILCADDRILVSSVVPGNSYNWNVGDELLALNGIAWPQWIPALQQSVLPILGRTEGNDEAVRLNWLKSINLNMGLFETVTIGRVDGTIETLEVGNTYHHHGEIKEMPFEKALDETRLITQENNFVSGGYLQNSNIAYIRFDTFNLDMNEYRGYANAFYNEFKNAIKDHLGSEAMIIDIRGHHGGNAEQSYGGLSYLIENKTRRMTFMNWAYRIPGSDKIDYTAMPTLFPKDDGEYTNPVIVLVDSSTVSAADNLIYIFSLFPHIKVIGQAHSGSNSGFMNLDPTIEEYNPWKEFSTEDKVFHLLYPVMANYHYSDMNFALLRRNFLDERVAYRAEDVINHEDSLFNRALEIIHSEEMNMELE
ncbi:MAG: S41 family peptidase [Spirochaetaceae bacterium]|jgi:hypothetical protein|nr:S41 family peptidase [Spirochaetaceae bacterium]